MVGSILVLPLRAFLLTLMQTCSHMPKRSHAYLRGLAASCRSDQAPHNNAAQIRWPTGSCARVGSRLPRRRLILTSVFFNSVLLTLSKSDFLFFFVVISQFRVLSGLFCVKLSTNVQKSLALNL